MTTNNSDRSQTAFIGLSARQITITALVGVVLWFVAANLLRLLAPLDIYTDPNRIWMYLLVVPGTVPFVWLMRRLAGLSRAQIFTGYSVGTMSATLCDGIALAWFPALYGGSSELVAGAGAVILWGAGVGLLLALFDNRPDSQLAE